MRAQSLCTEKVASSTNAFKVTLADVLARYSRGLPTARRIGRVRRALAEMPPRPAEVLWVAHGVARRLGQTTVAQLVRDYKSGDGCRILARRYNLSENGVLAQLKRSGVVLRPPAKVTVTDFAEMARLRASGWTYRALGERFGMTRTAVSARLNAS
jgi:hypothetical protein